MSSSKDQRKRKFLSTTVEPEHSGLQKKRRPSKKQVKFEEAGNTTFETVFINKDERYNSVSLKDKKVVIKSEDHSQNCRKLAAEPDSRKAHRNASKTASCSADAVQWEEAECKMKCDITFGCSLCHKEFSVEREYDEHMNIHLSTDEGDNPPDYEEMLYGDGSGDEGPMEEECLIEDDSEDEEIDLVQHDPPSPPYSPITHHSKPLLSPVQDWSGSRLPLDEADPIGVVIAYYAEDGTRLSDEFFAPDSHALFDSAGRLSESNIERGNRFGKGSKGRGRRGRGGRVGSRGQVRGLGGERRQHHRWQPGQHLEEIYMTDDDVPPELREMVNDLMRRRQARVEMEARRVRASELLHEGHNSESKSGDVFEDAVDGRDKSLVEGVDPHFEWSPMETFPSVEETFTPQRTGSVASYSTPYEAFRSFWDDDILKVIVDETNRYARRIPSVSFQTSWHPTNAHEVMCLFAFWMMIGIIRMPTILSYFSSDPLLRTEVFSRITSVKRYANLVRALNFADNGPSKAADPTNDDVASFGPLHRLEPIIDHLNIKFRENYVLSKDICIDESLTLWKGRLKFKQYDRSKAAKYGIKTFELCESTTRYLWSFTVYTGRDDSVETSDAKSIAVVLKLMRPLLNKGYRLFMDNWFNSPLLARILKRNGTDCVGTLRASRADVPKLVSHAPLRLGQLVARHSGDVCVLSWQDKKRITMISTCHGSATGLASVSSSLPSRLEQFKPQAVLDYNRAMGGVDLKDHMLEPYLLERKRGAKWYLKLFKRLLNCSIHNSRVLLESSLNARQDNLKFRLELVHAILKNHHPLIPLARRTEAFLNRTANFNHIVHHKHWPVRNAQTQSDRVKNSHTRQRCVVCQREGRKMSRTYYKCEDCNVSLCVEYCFKKYHTSV